MDTTAHPCPHRFPPAFVTSCRVVVTWLARSSLVVVDRWCGCCAFVTLCCVVMTWPCGCHGEEVVWFKPRSQWQWVDVYSSNSISKADCHNPSPPVRWRVTAAIQNKKAVTMLCTVRVRHGSWFGHLYPYPRPVPWTFPRVVTTRAIP